jgi:hypothetical protein
MFRSARRETENPLAPLARHMLANCQPWASPAAAKWFSKGTK